MRAYANLTCLKKNGFWMLDWIAWNRTVLIFNDCTTWTQTKLLEKTLDDNYTRMLRAILNKSGRQHPTRHQLYGPLPPITKTIQVRRYRLAGHCWRNRDELISDVILWAPHMDDQLEHTYSSYVRIRDVALKTCQRRWTIGRSGERWSGISVLAARHDDDEYLNKFKQKNCTYTKLNCFKYIDYMYKNWFGFK